MNYKTVRSTGTAAQTDDFEKNVSQMWKKIGTHGIMVLSTCAERRVTSRPVSVVAVGGKFYFQTDESYLKFRQIMQNDSVALSVKNFSIEGKCHDIGKPLDSINSEITAAIKKHFLLAYKSYSHIKSERLLEIVPTLIYSWSYELTKPYMEYWDFEKFTYHKEYK